MRTPPANRCLQGGGVLLRNAKNIEKQIAHDRKVRTAVTATDDCHRSYGLQGTIIRDDIHYGRITRHPEPFVRTPGAPGDRLLLPCSRQQEPVSISVNNSNPGRFIAVSSVSLVSKSISAAPPPPRVCSSCRRSTETTL